jgi:uncharacterized membrane protein
MEILISVGLYILICTVFGVFAAFVFYHIKRYSLIGDASKRAYVYYVGSMMLIILVSAIMIALNHYST